jgi:hypothetical protein
VTSLLGRLLRLFPERVRLEDLFTEAVARVFETNPQLCLAWLEHAGIVTPCARGSKARSTCACRRRECSLHSSTTTRLAA